MGIGMETRTVYLRRRKITTRYKKRLIGAGLAGVAACVAAVALVPGTSVVHPGSGAGHDAMPVAAAQVALATAAQSGRTQPRRIYPFSIVPGGVGSRADLQHMIRTDKVVAQHYATFAVDKAVLETVDKPRAVHVSYRKGDKVFWTAKTVMLAKGETLLTDGTSEIRGRCGNRISETAQLPVEEHGPGAEVLDTAMDADADTADHTVAAGYALAAGSAGGSYALQTFANGAGLVGATGAALAETRAANYGSMPAAPDAGGWWVSNGTKLAAATGTATGDAGTGTSTGGTSGGTDTSGTSGSTVDTGGTGTGTDGTGGTTGGTTTSGTGGTTTGGTGGTNTGGTGGTNTGGTDGTGGTNTGGTGNTDTGGGDVPPSSGDPSLPVTLPWPPHLPNQPATPPKDGDVPEPNTLWLSAIAVAALVLLRRKRARPQR